MLQRHQVVPFFCVACYQCFLRRRVYFCCWFLLHQPHLWFFLPRLTSFVCFLFASRRYICNWFNLIIGLDCSYRVSFGYNILVTGCKSTSTTVVAILFRGVSCFCATVFWPPLAISVPSTLLGLLESGPDGLSIDSSLMQRANSKRR